MADHGLINLFYFDESGFATVPCVPYAWQPLGATRELPSFPSQRLNILGFLSRDQQSFFQAVEGTIGTDQTIAAFDRFAADYAVDYARHGQPCVVTLDNAPWHTSRDFRERIDRWGAQGVILHYLPPYCPELNLIEDPLAQNQVRLATLVLLHPLRQPQKCCLGSLEWRRLQVPDFFCMTTYLKLFY